MASEAAIRIEGLNHSFGRGALRKQILFDITTSIPAGEIIIVTGPSGSGKTTLLTLVGALRSTQEGSVRVLGEELCGASSRVLEKVRQRIGFIFQQHNLVEALSAVQNVELGLKVGRRIGRRAKCWRRSAWATACTTSPSRCRAAGASAWPSRGRWPVNRPCCWPTSPPLRWTRNPAAKWSIACSRWRASRARPSCW